jgi:hypothetical protein
MLQLEAELYPLLEPGLDLEPDIAVTQRANMARYNSLKFQQTPRKSRRALAAQESSANIPATSGNNNSAGKRKRAGIRAEMDDQAERQTAKELDEWMTLLSPVCFVVSLRFVYKHILTLLDDRKRNSFRDSSSSHLCKTGSGERAKQTQSLFYPPQQMSLRKRRDSQRSLWRHSCKGSVVSGL